MCGLYKHTWHNLFGQHMSTIPSCHLLNGTTFFPVAIRHMPTSGLVTGLRSAGSGFADSDVSLWSNSLTNVLQPHLFRKLHNKRMGTRMTASPFLPAKLQQLRHDVKNSYSDQNTPAISRENVTGILNVHFN